MPVLIQTAFSAGAVTTTLFSVTFSTGQNPNSTIISINSVTSTNNNWASNVDYQLYWDGNSTLTATRMGGPYESNVFSSVTNGNVWSYQITPGDGQPGGNSACIIGILQTDDSVQPSVA